MRILGIDPGSRRCGYGVVDARGGSVVYVECGVIAPPPTAPLSARLAEILVEVRGVIDELRPQVAAVESVFFAKSAHSALRLGHARGVVLCAAGEADLPVFEYAPALVKRTISTSGKASKAQIAAMVRALLGLRRTPAVDATDALAVALTHARVATVSSAAWRLTRRRTA